MIRRFLSSIGIALFVYCGASIAIAPTKGLADTKAPAASDATAAAAPAASPIPFNHKVIYVFGGGDAPTRGKLIAQMIQHLQWYHLRDDAWLVAQPDWSMADFVSACKTQWQSTRGGLMVSLVASGTGAVDQFVQRKTWGEISGAAVFVECAPPDSVPTASTNGNPWPTPTPAPGSAPAAKPTPQSSMGIYEPTCLARITAHQSAKQIQQNAAYGKCFPPKPEPLSGTPIATWHSPMEDETAWHNTVTPFNPLAALLSIGGIYATVVPSKTSQTQTTFLYPAKHPSPAGTISSNQVTSSSTSNPSGLGSAAGTFFGNALNLTNSAISLPIADEVAWNAADTVVFDLIVDMNCELNPSRSRPAPYPALTPPPWYSQNDPKFEEAAICSGYVPPPK